MNPISNFSLQPVTGIDGNEMDKSNLLVNGRPTGKIVEGIVLEAQFECGRRGFVLLVTQNVPHEEELYIYFFSPMFELLDKVEISNRYTPGLLNDVRVVAEDQLRFSFFGDDHWILKVLTEPRRMPPAWPFSLVKRPELRFFAKHYLQLDTI